MKKSLFILLAQGLALASFAQADPASEITVGEDIRIANLQKTVQSKTLLLTADVKLDALDLPANGATVIVPTLISNGEKTELPGLAIYRRSRYYHCLRNECLLGPDGTKVIMYNEKPDTYQFSLSAPVTESQDDTYGLFFQRYEIGCCDYQKEFDPSTIQGVNAERGRFNPVYMYVAPTAVEVRKIRTRSGSAFIEFEVDKTDIQENRANNRVELAKIRASIDSVRDGDLYTILNMTLTGYASPDGPYKKNVRLAQGRTEVMGEYLRKLYTFDKKLLKTNSVPEDWQGLKERVDTATFLPHRKELMAIINNTALDPDVKEKQIKKYTEDYDIMRTRVLPPLRHTDYTIQYEVVEFTTADECRQAYSRNSNDLSLMEYYKCTEGVDSDSPYYLDVWQTAVKYFPEDEIANINAATAAMTQGKKSEAATYLEKAGNSPQANYARGNLAALNRKFKTAREYFVLADTQAKNLGFELSEAAEAVKQLDAKSLTRDYNERKQ